MKAIRGLTFIGVVTTGAICGDRLQASDIDAIRVLGLESAADWTVENGTLVGLSPTRTQGNSSLAVQPNGYTTVRSRLVGPLGNVSPAISFDLQLPTNQPNPFWFGAAQVFVSAPSIGLNNAYVGQRELTGLSTGSFVNLSFDLPSDIRTKLQGTYFDLVFSIVLNVPAGAGTYLIDNLQVSSSIPGNSTITLEDLPRILGMEDPADWTITSGTIVGTSLALKTQNNFSLAVQPNGYTTLTSLPMTSIGPVNPEITIDVRMPATQPNPTWFGAVQLFATLPSQNLYNVYLGQQELTGLATEQFHTLHFPLAEDIRAKLNLATYSDLRLTVVLNAPTPGAGIYHLDNIHVGPVTDPLEDIRTNLRTDLVGRTSDGAVSIEIDDEGGSPPVQDALFYVRSDDGNCVPSDVQVCRYLVPAIRIRTGAFEIDGEGIASALIRNVNPFRLTLGGSHGLSARIPSGQRFVALVGDDILTAGASRVSMTVNPAGDGLISVSGTLTGTVDDNRFEIGLSITADTPLENRMPIASAGADQSLTSTSGCTVIATLNGTGTQDPDGGLQRITWLANGTVFSGVGPTVQVPINTAGPNIFTALAVDAFGAESKDETTVNVTLPGGCP